MATIKDVAAKAGVSISSVSNFLNNRPGLGDETARRIERTIEELHYVVRNAARDLRSAGNGEIGIIFPGISEPYMEKLINSIKGYLAHRNHGFFLELTNSDPESENKAVLNALGKKVEGLILYTCQQENAALFQRLEAARLPYVLIDRKPAGLACNFVTCDNEALFSSLVCAAAARGVRRIAMILGPSDCEENRRAAVGAQAAAEECGDVHLRTIYTTAIRECGFKAGMQLLGGGTCAPQLVLTTSFLLAEGIRYAMNISHLDPRKQVQIVCTGDCVQDVFYNDDTIAKTSRSTFEMGECVAKTLLENIKSPVIFDREHFAMCDTFSPEMLRRPAPRPAQAAAPSEKSITVLLIDEHSSVDSLSQLLVNFYAREKIRVDIRKVQPQEQYDYIENYIRSGSDEIDVFLFDIPWLTYFAAKGYLLCLDELIRDYKVEFDHLIPGILPAFGKHEGRYYALPYLACVQLLFYRRDLFRSETLRRDFEKQNMLPLRPPKNWLQFNAIARFFTQSCNAAAPTKYGHSMGVSYPENLLCDLMPRLWEAQGSLFDRRQRVQVNTPQFHKAVRSLAESALYAAPNLFANRPIDTVEDFINGDAAMVYTFNYFAIGVGDKDRSAVYRNYATVPIPGHPVLSGWSLGIAANSRRADEAFRFIRWASGADMAIPQTILGGQSPNVSVYRNYDLASLYPWLPLALHEFENTRTRLTPRNAAGQVTSEKIMENLIFQQIDPFLRQTVASRVLDDAALTQMLPSLQASLDEIL